MLSGHISSSKTGKSNISYPIFLIYSMSFIATCCSYVFMIETEKSCSYVFMSKKTRCFYPIILIYFMSLIASYDSYFFMVETGKNHVLMPLFQKNRLYFTFKYVAISRNSNREKAIKKRDLNRNSNLLVLWVVMDSNHRS